jgi:hypothetical protein
MSFLNCVIITMIVTITSVSTTDDSTATYRRPLIILVDSREQDQVTVLDWSSVI